MDTSPPTAAGRPTLLPSGPELPVLRIGTTRERIAAAIHELTALGKCFTRQLLKKLTELPFHIIDDHVDKLIEEGQVQRIGNGIFELVTQWRPEIPVSMTTLDDGSVKLERGDSVWHMTPSEMRKHAKQVAGWAQEGGMLEGQELILATMAALDARTRRMLEAQQKTRKLASATPRQPRRRSAATA